MVERGLRAKLEPVSLLTGQYMVSLSLGATSPPLYVGAADGAIEIPAVESTRERVMDMLEKVPLDRLADEATGALMAIRRLMDSGDIQALIAHANDSVGRIGKLADGHGGPGQDPRGAGRSHPRRLCPARHRPSTPA